jgi:hypothetical protein
MAINLIAFEATLCPSFIQCHTVYSSEGCVVYV